MLTDTDAEDHYNPSVRLLELERNGNNCGFKLTRSKWDPYPWVTSVEDNSAAFHAGIKHGDCLLEVNGEDIVGQRISEIADLVKAKSGQVALLLWNAGLDQQCSPETLCCGPMPNNLQRLIACMSSILAFLECPVCLDTIQPPSYQCDNGHLICIRCRAKSERCPVCRQRLNRGRSLLSDQVYNSIIEAFGLKEESDETKSARIQQIFKLRKNKNVPDIKITQSHTNKFLSKLVGKASSVDNLSSSSRFLTPNPASESGLKTKSLSTNEIFQPETPPVSRSSSIIRISRNEKNKSLETANNNRSASYHGSFESLNRKIDDVAPINCYVTEDNTLYHCPFISDCTSLINGKNLVEHFQLTHKGPLVQFFNSHLQMQLNKIIDESDVCYVISFEGNTFFLKIILNKTLNQEETLGYSKDILMWVWYQGTKKNSKDYEMQVELKDEQTKNTLLSVRSSVFSLNCVSVQEIKDCKKGIFFSAKTLNVINQTASCVLLDLKILRTECE